MTTAVFASLVRNAAREVPPAGRFGDNKAYIHRVHATGRFSERFGMSLEAFKAQLWDARTRVELSRADLVEAMDPSDVRKSALRPFGSVEFNFIVTD